MQANFVFQVAARVGEKIAFWKDCNLDLLGKKIASRAELFRSWAVVRYTYIQPYCQNEPQGAHSEESLKTIVIGLIWGCVKYFGKFECCMITFWAKHQTKVAGFCLNMSNFKDCEDFPKKIAILILKKARSLRS